MEKAVLIGVQTYKSVSFEERMQEMKELALACDIQIQMTISQNLEHPHTKYYLNPGKVKEVKRIVDDLESNYVIVFDAISPSVQRNLSKYFDCEVMDKSALILEIFASRAKTKESILQVECARLKYLLPRLQGSYTHMDRQRGGSRNKGMGEKKIELDARRIESKIHSVEKELKKIETQRSVQRNLRKKSLVKSVALTGYTNAGKSSILNGFIQEDKTVFEKDMLFATLTTSTRQIETENHNIFTLSDTVGFISDLPHTLVQAFHSTLEEAVVSDLILKVVDISSEHKDQQLQVCEETLKEIGCEKIPYLYVFNKCDQVHIDYPKRENNRIYMSAKEASSIAFLKKEIEKELFHLETIQLHIPYEKTSILDYIHKNGKVLQQEYQEDGIELTFTIRQDLIHRVDRLIRI